MALNRPDHAPHRAGPGRRGLIAVALVGVAVGPVRAVAARAQAPTAAGMLDEAELAFQRGQIDQARSVWQGLADAGDPDAQLRLGLFYDQGRGVPADPAAALRWYQRAASAGLPAALFNVAVMTDNGLGTARDSAAAATWYARAAARGHARAAYNLAMMYEHGEGVPRDPEAALAWYRAAAVALPAAAQRVATVAVAAPPIARPGPPPAPPAPRWPEEGGSIVARAGAELVWTAAPREAGARVFAQVIAIDGGAVAEVFGAFTDRTAMLVPLPDRTGAYAWRAYCVTAGTGHYIGGEWTRFQATGAA